jgi:hypothetical protein
MDELDNIMKRDYTFGTKPKEIASDLYMPIATRHLASARRFIEFIPEHAVSPDILIELLKIYKDPPPTIKLPEPEGKRPIPIPTQELDISKYLVLASKALVERIGPEGLTPEKGSHIIHLAKEVNLKKTL